MYEVLANLKNEKLKNSKIKKAPPVEEKECPLKKETYTILIAEDNEVNMFLTKILVQELSPNSTVLQARDGEEAVQLFFKNKPDLVLMDIQMPNMNGYEATQAIRLKETGKPTPIAALTAGNMSGEREKSFKAGMNDFMAKPIIKKDLGKLFDKWLKTNKIEGDKPDYKKIGRAHV